MSYGSEKYLKSLDYQSLTLTFSSPLNLDLNKLGVFTTDSILLLRIFLHKQ